MNVEGQRKPYQPRGVGKQPLMDLQ